MPRSYYTKRGQIVDKEYALNMFSDKHDESIGRLVQFIQETNSDVCLEVQEIKVNVSDDHLREIVRRQFGIDAIKFVMK